MNLFEEQGKVIIGILGRLVDLSLFMERIGGNVELIDDLDTLGAFTFDRLGGGVTLKVVLDLGSDLTLDLKHAEVIVKTVGALTGLAGRLQSREVFLSSSL